jgi:hypothetical protein
MALHQEKAFCVLCFEVSRSVITVHLKTDHTESPFLLRRHLGNWLSSLAVNMRSELVIAHEKLGQLPLLTVSVLPV